jgi:repressor LexA
MFLPENTAWLTLWLVAKRELHPVQRHLVKVLSENADEPLTISEMMNVLKVSSKSVVVHHLRQLEKKGYLKRNPHNPRDYHVMTDGPERQFTYLNVYGLAQCGARGSFLDGNPVDRIAVPSRLLSFPAVDAFVVQAKGNSMAPRINDGDLVIARRTNSVDSGRVVVCVNDGEALIKKVHIEHDGCILVSTNLEHAPFSASSDLRIIGEVRAVMSHRVE